jgi:photosystem II stability/assembly factor-like uncharacterized protein
MKMLRKERIVLFLLFFLFLVDKLYAQPYPKDYPCIHRLDAYGAKFLSLAVAPTNPEIVYAGTELFLYKSFDGGKTWMEYNNYGIPKFTQIWAVAIDPVNPDVVYAGTAFKGLYKSMDGGLTWSKVFPGEESKSRITSIAINPLNPQIVYIAVTNGSQYQGVYKSTDGGATWQAKNNGLYELSVGPIVMDPNNPDVLYLGGTVSYPLYKSTDGGETWVLLHPVDGYAIESIAVNPSNSSIVYAASVTDVYKSTDGGLTWMSLNVKLDGIYSLAMDPTNPEILYVGTLNWVYKSTDGGNTWTQLNPSLSPYLFIEGIVIPSSSTIFAFSRAGHIFKSVDGGETWEVADKGIREFGPAPFEHGIAVAPSNPNIIVAAGPWQVISKSIDGGKTWMELKTLNFNGMIGILSVAISPLDPNVVFVGIDKFPIPPIDESDATLYKSTDGGNTWVPKPREGGNDGYAPWAVEFTPSNPSIMFSGADGTIYKSTDYGESWTMVRFKDGADDVSDIEVNPLNPDIVYFSYANMCAPETGVWKSVDGGATWFQASNGLPTSSKGGYCTVSALEIDPKNPDIIYVGIDDTGDCDDRIGSCWGVFKSTNGGASWIRVGGNSLFAYPITSLEIDPDNPNIIYAGSGKSSSWVFVSNDGGSTWRKIPSGSEYTGKTTSLQLTNTFPRHLFFSTYEGIFKVTIPPATGARPITYCECPG